MAGQAAIAHRDVPVPVPAQQASPRGGTAVAVRHHQSAWHSSPPRSLPVGPAGAAGGGDLVCNVLQRGRAQIVWVPAGVGCR